MTMKVRFSKMHGAGNDYIYVDTFLYNISDPAKASILWSAPHTGIGSDGLVLIGKATQPGADYSMRIFNADGSEAMMCGNASRCIGKYLYEKGLTRNTSIRLQTLSGIKMLNLHLSPDCKTVESVTVDMLAPITANTSQLATPNGSLIEGDVEALGQHYCGTFVSMGNPHFVIFVDDVSRVDLPLVGPILENHPLFPERCNIEFAEVRENNVIRTRVWERGSGITMACGTGACATAVAAALTGRAPRSSEIEMDGGTLSINWSTTDGHVYMTGPAAFSFEGEILLDEE